MKVQCLQCQRRPAAVDLMARNANKGQRYFCSIQCAAAWALHQVDGELKWCPDCSRWYMIIEGCTTCVRFTIPDL